MIENLFTAHSLTLPEMEKLAVKLAKLLKPGDMVTLRGELGAGKTSFARALVQALSAGAVEVTSPTFNLMQSYDITLGNGQRETLWHLDLYRLEEPEEAQMLGLRELENHVLLMEWPEIVEHTLPAKRLDITITFGTNDTRDVSFRGNESWKTRIKTIK